MKESFPLHAKIPNPEQSLARKEAEMSDGVREAIEFAKSIGSIYGRRDDEKEIIEKSIRPGVHKRLNPV